MTKKKAPESKMETLREQGALNPHPERVKDSLFEQHDFFDPRDLIQVKYEMLRLVEKEGENVSCAAETFGLSRPTFYEARKAFEKEGLVGLLPRKRGPRGAHKLSEEVMEFVESFIEETDNRKPTELEKEVREKFGIRVHPRSFERALRRRKKTL